MDFGPDLPRPGETFAGKYRVDRVLGAGGMGVVLAVTHVELGERRAVKFMLPSSLGDTVALERFLREARAAAKLKSDHVARVHDVGRTEHLAPYIVLEYLEGEDLASVVKRGPVSIDRAVDFVIQACDAIAEAHAAGIVHRDLKPANLFLTAGADGGECIKVLDFGISKLGEGAAPSQLTDTEATIGSPFHMSPEQMRSSSKVDRRTDVWSLGVVLYQLVTGELPFQGEGRYAVCFAIAEDPPVPPRARRADLPAGLEAAILRCLEKKPEARFQDVAELCLAIAPFSSTPETEMRVRRIQRLAGGRGDASTDGGSSGVVRRPPPLQDFSRRTGEGATQSSWGGAPVAKAARGRRVSVVVFASLITLVGSIAAVPLFVWPQRTAATAADPAPTAASVVAPIPVTAAGVETAASPASAAPEPPSASPSASSEAVAASATASASASAKRPAVPHPWPVPVRPAPATPTPPAAAPSDPWGHTRKL